MCKCKCFILSPVTSDSNNYSCLSVHHDSHAKSSVGFTINKKILEICIIQCLLWDTNVQINTNTSTVHKQKHTQTYWNASGICHNRPPLMEWCLINRGLEAKPWRYHSPLLQSHGDSSAFPNKPVFLSLPQTHYHWMWNKSAHFYYNTVKSNICGTEHATMAVVESTIRYSCIRELWNKL